MTGEIPPAPHLLWVQRDHLREAPSDIGNSARARLIRRYRDLVAVQRVLRTRDRQWRVEFHADGRVDLIRHGAKVLVRATLDQVGKRLASEGLDLDELVED